MASGGENHPPPQKPPHYNVYGEACAELKTEAAPESALRSSLFKEQTAWLLQGPSRGNDRLTHGRREKGTHCKNGRRGAVGSSWTLITHTARREESQICIVLRTLESALSSHKHTHTHRHNTDVTTDVVSTYVWWRVCVFVCGSERQRAGKLEWTRGSVSHGVYIEFKPKEIMILLRRRRLDMLLPLFDCVWAALCQRTSMDKYAPRFKKKKRSRFSKAANGKTSNFFLLRSVQGLWYFAKLPHGYIFNAFSP